MRRSRCLRQLGELQQRHQRDHADSFHHGAQEHRQHHQRGARAPLAEKVPVDVQGLPERAHIPVPGFDRQPAYFDTLRREGAEKGIDTRRPPEGHRGRI